MLSGIEEHDDLFHAVYEMGKEAYHLEQGGYRAIGTVDELTRRRAKAEVQRRSLGQQLRRARVRMDAAVDRYDRFEALRREAGRVLELTDRGSGRLRTSAEVVEVLTRVAEEMKAIGGKRVRSVARYLGNRAAGLGRYLDGLAARLKDVEETAANSEDTKVLGRAHEELGLALWQARDPDARTHLEEAAMNLPSGRLSEQVLEAIDEMDALLLSR
ncbi:MAG: hypothetical protein HN348_31450 [Proteobacteria bacterium]|nr:hypothetical protein [Pseudomonadota bacterium]